MTMQARARACHPTHEALAPSDQFVGADRASSLFRGHGGSAVACAELTEAKAHQDAHPAVAGGLRREGLRYLQARTHGLRRAIRARTELSLP